MDILKLPTDNLYIFLTLGGLLLFVFSINQLFKSFTYIRLRMYKADKKVKSLEVNFDYQKKAHDANSDAVQMHRIAFEKRYQIKFRKPHLEENSDIHDFIPENLNKQEVVNYLNDYREIVKLTQELEKSICDIKLESINITIYAEKLKFLVKDLIFRTITFSLLIMISSFVIFFGFYSWYNKHQIFQDGMIKTQYEKSMSIKK